MAIGDAIVPQQFKGIRHWYPMDQNILALFRQTVHSADNRSGNPAAKQANLLRAGTCTGQHSGNLD